MKNRARATSSRRCRPAMNLIATGRSSNVSCASQTSPIAPRPSERMIWYSSTTCGGSQTRLIQADDTLADRSGSMTRIYYACFAHDEPRGGIKVIYRHVDLLNRAGLEAYVFHPQEKFRVSWFEHDTAIVGPRELARSYDARRDVLVLPEDMIAIPAGRELVEGPGKKVIFNQNVFFGFGVFGTAPPGRSPYRAKGVRAVFAVSDHNAALL